MWKICVDLDKCAGLGMCESFAPELFEVQDTGKVRVLDESPGNEWKSMVQDAIDGCPTEAITMVEGE